MSLVWTILVISDVSFELVFIVRMDLSFTFYLDHALILRFPFDQASELCSYCNLELYLDILV